MSKEQELAVIRAGMLEPQGHCHRPCHDCPFRRDIVPYQSDDDVSRNLLTLTAPYLDAGCHHTHPALMANRGKSCRLLACAGALLMKQQQGLSSPYLLRVGHVRLLGGNLVFRSLDELALCGACPDQSQAGRMRAWSSSQPPHVAARYALPNAAASAS